MKTTSTFSIRLDEKVIISMVAVSLIALLFTAFRYKNYKPCEAFQFNVYANYFNVGHYIFFKTADTKNAEKWEWDFGDKSPVDKKSGPLVSHIYKEPGQYIISLTINGECKQYQNIVINNVVKDSIRYVFPTVIWPLEPILVGQNIMFQDATNGANRWEWYVGEGKDSKRFTSKDVPFTFQKPGVYVVKLFVNGNIDAKQERTFRVQDAVAVAKPAKINRPIQSRGPRLNIKDAPESDPFGGTAKPVAEAKPAAPIKAISMNSNSPAYMLPKSRRPCETVFATNSMSCIPTFKTVIKAKPSQVSGLESLGCTVPKGALASSCTQPPKPLILML